MRRPLSLAALALTVALTSAACGSDDDSSLPEVGSSASTSPSPSPSATPSWSPTAKPQRPADELSKEGAEAFAKYVADTVLYVMATGDAPALTSIADLNTCDDCRGWDENYSNGKIVKLMIGTAPPTYTTTAPQRVNDKVFYKVSLAMDIPRGTTVRKDNGKEMSTIPAAKDLPFVVDQMWKDDQWQLMRYKMGG